MTIEEMVQWLDDHDDEDWQEKQAIRAALYAGQALAKTVKRWDDGFISGREARKQVTEKRKAFDAATRSEG